MRSDYYVSGRFCENTAVRNERTTYLVFKDRCEVNTKCHRNDRRRCASVSLENARTPY